MVFESNAGYMQVHAILEAAGDRSKVGQTPPDEVHKRINDCSSQALSRMGCMQWLAVYRLAKLDVCQCTTQGHQYKKNSNYY